MAGTRKAVQNGLPKYQQVTEALMAQIQSGQLAAGSQVPTEAELCDEYGVSRVTVRHALQYLEAEGMLSRERGRGTFVTDPGTLAPENIMISFLLIDVPPEADYNFREIHTMERHLSGKGVPFAWASLTTEDIVRGRFPAILTQGLCNGLILDGHVTAAHMALGERFGVKVLALGNHDIPQSFPQVRLNVAGDTREIVARLGRQYGRKVILAVEPLRMAYTRDVCQGYSAGLEDLEQPEELIYYCPDDKPGTTLARLISEGADVAIVTTDQIYLRIKELYAAAGRNMADVPVAVFSSKSSPDPVTGGYPVYQLLTKGERYQKLAADRLIDLIQGRRDTVYEELDYVVVEPKG